jgi:hypothetical protein
MLRGGASYQGNTAGGDVSRSWALDGSVGIRHALTPPEPLEVSWYGALKAGYAHQDTGIIVEDTVQDAAMQAWSAGLQLGTSLDKQLTDWFGLRLRIDLAELGYQRASIISAAAYSPPAESWYAQLKLAPSFAVRFTF